MHSRVLRERVRERSTLFAYCENRELVVLKRERERERPISSPYKFRCVERMVPDPNASKAPSGLGLDPSKYGSKVDNPTHTVSGWWGSSSNHVDVFLLSWFIACSRLQLQKLLILLKCLH
ncbi:hypothetical protein L1987_06588 [Smallanthus sonchifolius]|uniref:Uncharacterized protein n=1 Tax=Smallanthus sonchifolius TaxID=185202 RepID=A0ACB9JYM8_9ASTR|nr:hypothetical protein L1987_06588 [Smallanthus sonchifolius]